MQQPLPPLDRDAERRLDAEIWTQIDADPTTRVVFARRGEIAIHDGRMFWTQPTITPHAERIYLGLARSIEGIASGSPIELRLIADADAAEFDDRDASWVSLRRLVREFGADQLELALTAIALANWRSTHRYCPRCGELLGLQHAGWVLECVACTHQVFPRTDPAVIVRVLDQDDRILLGANAAWEQNRYSLLAGFVEAGESLEQAVVREVREESGVAVSELRYLGSQAWPFPASLMLGFEARTDDPAATPDGEEIVELRWFDREQIQDPGVVLPGPGSIARHLIEQWRSRQ